MCFYLPGAHLFQVYDSLPVALLLTACIGLAMSRAFGDLPCRRIGVTVEPEVSVHPLRADDEVLVAATDGVWDVLSNEEVVALAGGASGAQAAARMLVEVAEARWLETEGGYIDDITAVVVRAQPAGAASSA